MNLAVQGTVKLANASRVGSTSSRINQALIAGGCNGYAPCRWNGGGDRVWATTVGTSPPTVTRPTADFDYWYLNASPGPRHPCTTVVGTPPTFENETTNPTRNSSAVTVDLTPSSSYTCRTASGELSWDAATKTLTVRGVIFVDGSVTAGNNATNNYNGQASLYVNNTFTLNNSTEVCGGVTAGHCDFGAWNPNTELLIVVVNGSSGGDVQFADAARFQGGIYATRSIKLADAVRLEGPLIGSTVEFAGSAQAKPFPLISTVPLGTPGNPNVYADPQPPANFGG